MTDDRRYAGIVQIRRNEDGGIGVGIIVPHDQFQGTTPDASLRIDLLHGQLGSPLHGSSYLVAEGSGEPDANRFARRLAGQQHQHRGYQLAHRFSTMPDWSDRAPDAIFDLHGQSVLEAAANAERFLRAQAKARPGGVVRLITGRGRAGHGAPIRTRVRTLLRGLKESNRLVRDYQLEDSDGSFLIRLCD
jgi:hypothetical protein